MRVMVLVKATEDSEAGLMPPTELIEAMGKFNEDLAKAGVLLAGDGLKPECPTRPREYPTRCARPAVTAQPDSDARVRGRTWKRRVHATPARAVPPSRRAVEWSETS